MHGIGKLTYANGDIYEGSFVDGKKSGSGLLRYKDENVIDNCPEPERPKLAQ